jgi:DNA (cytosine-5)-methyltransferase 1
MAIYYNEIEPRKAAWLRELMAAGDIAQGEVDERSIRDVQPEDLDGFVQCHFFAGVGVWQHCLRRAKWPDDRPVWTGSPPCQPFSVAGKKKAQADDRHLWPELARLIQKRRPQSFFGEQVASKDGLAWIDVVYADMEAAGYAVGAVDICAAGFGAPHIRQRLAIVANADGRHTGAEWQQRSMEQRLFAQGSGLGVGLADTAQECGDGSRREGRRSGESANSGGMGQPKSLGWSGRENDCDGGRRQCASGQAGEIGSVGNAPSSGPLPGAQRNLHRSEESPRTRNAELERSGRDGVTQDDTIGAGLEGHAGHGHNWTGWQDEARPIAPAGVVSGHWSGAELVWCKDGKWRPIEPATFPLVDGTAEKLVRSRDPGTPIDAQATAEARTLRLKGYGDAIVTDAYVAVIEAAMELWGGNTQERTA